MASDQVLVAVQQVEDVPLDYEVPGTQELALQSVTAVFDGTSASGDYLPALQIIGPGNVVAATFVDKDNAVTAGDSVEVTFGTFLRKQAAPCPPCEHYDFLIELLGPDAWWKFNESSGLTAADSTGNMHPIDANVTAPTWRNSVAPTGQPAPLLSTGQGFGRSLTGNIYQPVLSGDFTVAMWLWTTGAADGQTDGVMSQGNPIGSANGWRLGVDGTSISGGTALSLLVGGGGGESGIKATDLTANNTWYFYAARHSGTEWDIFVNGVKQAATYSGPYDATTTNITVGGATGTGQQISYGMLFVKALSDSDIALLYSGV